MGRLFMDCWTDAPEPVLELRDGEHYVGQVGTLPTEDVSAIMALAVGETWHNQPQGPIAPWWFVTRVR